jgi:hypothetical protein
MTPMTTHHEVPEKVEDRLIVALDVPSISEARALIDKLEGVTSFFKVGLWLQFAAGFDGLLDYLLAKNKNIFPVLCSKRHLGGRWRCRLPRSINAPTGRIRRDVLP